VISTNAEKMGVLIDALLSFSRVGRAALSREAVDMRALARSAVHEVNAREPGRAIEFVIGDLPDCVGNPLLMRQVWSNLLGNAAKFTRTRERAVVVVDGARTGDELVYSVKDNGIGFDMKYASKLFGVFQRLHDGSQYEGAGVGLALVQRIILRHGGRVWADATTDQGATFSFTLPVEPAKP
jgi:light-regulated signal transduction histidine kinase (bacteriophytochrome)